MDDADKKLLNKTASNTERIIRAIEGDDKFGVHGLKHQIERTSSQLDEVNSTLEEHRIEILTLKAFKTKIIAWATAISLAFTKGIDSLKNLFEN